MTVGLIWAQAANGVIGAEGALPWHLPEDLAHFKRVTLGAPVIMGRKTWDSLPARFRPLPGRRNLVVTRDAGWQAEGAEAMTSFEAALDSVAGTPKAFVIGGGQLYALALPRADELVLTEIDAELDGDVFFPAFDRARFIETARESRSGFSFVTYKNTRGD